MLGLLRKCFVKNRRIARRSGSGERVSTARLAKIETLEDRRALSINWVNATDSNNGFATFGANSAIAAEAVARAVADWNRVITDLNYDNDNNSSTNNTFSLSITVADLFGARGQAEITSLTTNANGWDAGVPTAAAITLDDDGGGFFSNDATGAGDGWFFDQTPSDDAEFTGIVNPFQANFVDASQPTNNYNDFYRTIAHEIGHALGIAFFGPGGTLTRITNHLTYAGTDQI